MRKLIIIETDDSGKFCHKDCEGLGVYCQIFGKMLDYKGNQACRCEMCRLSGAISEDIWRQELNPRKAT